MVVHINVFLKNSGERETSTVVETDLSNSELQKEIDKIENSMKTDNYTIYDVLDELERLNLIYPLQHDIYDVDI